MPRILLDGIEFNYEEAGSGEPLLLLHGGLGTARLHFWREIDFFAQFYHVVAPDQRGYGRSSPPRDFPDDFYYRDAGDMIRFIEALGLAPAQIAGWSDGGIIALLVAVWRPDLVRSLALWGAEARLTAEERAGWDALIDTSGWTDGAKRRFIEAQGPLNWPQVLTRMRDGYHAFYNAHAGEIISSRLAEIQAPVLILHGDQDPVVPVLHAHELAHAIPHARVRIFEGGGHALHRERETELREEILRFLASISGEI